MADRRAEAISRLRRTRAFLVDLDGTTYIDMQPSPGAVDFLGGLRDRGNPHVFLSNNSSKSGNEYVDRLTSMGISVTRDNVMTSGDATIEYLSRRTEHRSIYLVGTEPLEADFRAAGFHLVDLDPASGDPDCVVVAFDTTVTFAKLERACALLMAGKPYYATHPDKTCITARGLIPDIAAIIAACEAVTGRSPTIIGKPEPAIVELALEVLGATAAETAIVGDQLDTDMVMGRQSGLLSCLVMTGETSQQRLEALEPAQRPELVVSGVAELHELLTSG